MRQLVALAAVALLMGCAMSNPTLSSNPHLQQVGEDQARRDIWQCRALAEQVVRPTLPDQVRHHAVIGHRTGEGIQFVRDVIYDHPKRGGALGSDKPAEVTPAWKESVRRCLEGRGYEVAGWE